MPFTLQPLIPPDIPLCVSLYFTSFHNPHSLACWPRTPPVRAWWEHMLSSELSEPGAHWLKAVHTGSGELAGFVKWVRHPAGQVVDEGLPGWPEGADETLCGATFGVWAREHGRLMGRRGHWYLEIVATSPTFQGQGAGSQMICWGTAKADAEGWEAFLEASPDAVRLYERHGFREAARADTWIENERVSGTWYRNLFMIRPPRAHVQAEA